jgi:hypothetical protein
VTRIWQAERWLTSALGIALGAGLVASATFAILHRLVETFSHNQLQDQQYITIAVGGLTIVGGLGFVSKGLSESLGATSLLQLNPLTKLGDLVHDRSDGVLDTPSHSKGQPMYYVVDIALEGVKLRRVAKASSYGQTAFWLNKHDRFIESGQVASRLETSMEVWTGCAAQCSGVNWYCDNNQWPGRYDGIPPQPLEGMSATTVIDQPPRRRMARPHEPRSN